MIKKNLKALHYFYPDHLQAYKLDKNDFKNLPIWVKNSIDVHIVELDQTERIYLLTSKNGLKFDQLLLIHKLVSEEIASTLLLKADNLPAKYRPLLVRSRIPFIYNDEAIFAPALGLKFNNLKILDVPSKVEIRPTTESLRPISLKIVSGILTGFIDKEFNLKNLHKKLMDQGFRISMGKLGASLKELSENQLLLVQGSGPQKHYICHSRELTWDTLQKAKFSTFFHSFKTNYLPKEHHLFVYSGETALSTYSNLASPHDQTIAITTQNFKSIYKEQAQHKNLDLENQNTVQVWKENPALFSIDGVMNPIELYFSLVSHPDERVQKSLTEMLFQQGLTRNGD